MAEGPPGLLIEAVLGMTGYGNWLRSQDDGEKRLANLERSHELAERPDAEDLREFLDELSLAGELDTGSDPQGLALSTIHAAAKGSNGRSSSWLDWKRAFCLMLVRSTVWRAKQRAAGGGATALLCGGDKSD
jgi:hypothetical protein